MVFFLQIKKATALLEMSGFLIKKKIGFVIMF